MWPKIEHDSDGYMLAASHAIGRNAIIDEEVAVFLANLLLERYPARLAERYGFPVDGLDAVAVVEGVAKRRALRTRAAISISRKPRWRFCRITVTASSVGSVWKRRRRAPRDAGGRRDQASGSGTGYGIVLPGLLGLGLAEQFLGHGDDRAPDVVSSQISRMAMTTERMVVLMALRCWRLILWPGVVAPHFGQARADVST